MIELFIKNKFGRNVISTSEEQSGWRSFFKSSEDSLTASVVGLIGYLPAHMIFQILRQACHHFNPPSTPKKLVSAEFWPHWDNAFTSNTTFVEPDVYFEFDTCDIVIEAKRYDDVQQQNREQWRNEIVGYINEYGERKKEMYFIALSGLANVQQRQEEITVDGIAYNVATTGWRRILRAVMSLWNEERRTSDNELTDSNLDRIFQDIVRAFSLHGFFVGETLDSLPKKYSIGDTTPGNRKFLRYSFWKKFPNNLRNISPHLQMLNKWQA